ncbi:hypothetical protein GT354_11205 [Streptomyces sp. SID3343]|nr:hypothetical protein [Streptomyces sp. SID3343]
MWRAGGARRWCVRRACCPASVEVHPDIRSPSPTGAEDDARLAGVRSVAERKHPLFPRMETEIERGTQSMSDAWDRDGETAGLHLGNGHDVPGLKPLPDELAPDLREFAMALRGLFKATGKSLRQFAVYHHLSPPSVSRYLAALRIPEKSFVDALLKSAYHALDRPLDLEMQAYVYRLHREALLSEQPGRYRMQLASDRLEQVVLEQEQAELQIRELRASVSDRKRLLRELERRIHDVEDAATRQRLDLAAELDVCRRERDALSRRCEQLSSEILVMEDELRLTKRERDEAMERCAHLEAQLARVQAEVEREEKERRDREERLRLVAASGLDHRYLGELERIHAEAEQVRLHAARDTAALHHLRDMAQDVARHRLPALIEQVTENPENMYVWVHSVGIHERDDINQLARAFDEVHREAVRLATEQALLRGNVNAMFVNLSRRTSKLIQRHLTLISDLENREADPDQLANLFKLDHLATRMRRNSENLLVLAGEEPGRSWTQPVPLRDVLRAAASEVEHYERIQLGTLPDSLVAGRVVNALVHLLAELLENATMFSTSRVQVGGSFQADSRPIIEIHDSGIGLTQEELADTNDRLAHPPVVDVSVAHRMGLFVVGRLATRHDIHVRLSPAETGGTVALVTLPVDAVLRPKASRRGSARHPSTSPFQTVTPNTH